MKNFEPLFLAKFIGRPFNANTLEEMKAVLTQSLRRQAERQQDIPTFHIKHDVNSNTVSVVWDDPEHLQRWLDTLPPYG